MINPNESAEVCLVDDDPSVLRSMQYLLASDGLAVHAFNKAEDFLAHVSKHRVPVVVLDIWMEKVTGLEVLARLCALSPKTRVIVITARDDLAARATAMAIGPVAFFIKPFNDEKFLAAVRDALAQAKNR
ncbi:MAG TPA: response regulator [Chthoniobacterales bacterium]|jgi:two-component system response regulator FixJ